MAAPLILSLSTPIHLLVLIGGGEFSFGETRAIDEFLLARMPSDRRTVAFLPTASGSAEYALHLGKYLQEIDPDVRTVNVPVYRGRDNRRPKNLELLLSAGMIYLGGGVVHSLLATLRGSPAEIALRQAAQNGTVIAAIGASASSMGAWVGDSRGTSPLPGLDWLSRTAVEAGFDSGEDAALRRLMYRPEIEIGVGLPPRMALAIHGDGSTEIVGQGQMAVFRKPSRGL